MSTTAEPQVATDLTHAVQTLFAPLAADAWVHAVNLDTGAEVGAGSDDPVVLCSVFKVAALVELYRRADEGTVDPRERVRVTAEDRVLGPFGLSVAQDEVEMSLRDLAMLMMSVSDNTATDLLLDRLGIDAINQMLEQLRLPEIALVGNCRHILYSAIDELGVASEAELAALPIERIYAVESTDPARTTRGTARSVVRLLELIWTDRAASRSGCSEIRRLMSHQVRANQLAAASPSGWSYAGKTGSLLGLRNEAGVYTSPDGQRIAVAVFTRELGLGAPRPDIEAAIAALAREALRRLMI